MKFCIIGCGLIGRKRAFSISKEHQISCVVDNKIELAKDLSEKFNNCTFTNDWKEAIRSNLSEVIIIALPHDLLQTVSIFALENNKPVFIEKPGAINAIKLKKILEISMKKNLTVKIGYNHRFHPALIKAKELIDENLIGSLMYVRGRYGHGGRLGYEKEWRSNKSISGGGELLDQGSHLIDLSIMFLGEFKKIQGNISNFYWKMNVEDNAFIFLETNDGKTAWLHASWTEWKNLFSFEIFGEKGKIQIDGLGGSYGTEKITLYKMLPELGPPETTSWEFPFHDKSWNLEIENFIDAIKNGKNKNGNLDEAISVLEIIEEIYKKNP
jgi:predicted dehydrogenase